MEAETDADVPTHPATPVTEKRKGTKRPSTPHGDPRIGEALSILRTAVNQQKEVEQGPRYDDSSIFGQHVANKLRKYTPRVRDMVQYHLNTVLYHADMGNADLQIVPVVKRTMPMEFNEAVHPSPHSVSSSLLSLAHSTPSPTMSHQVTAAGSGNHSHFNYQYEPLQTYENPPTV